MSARVALTLVFVLYYPAAALIQHTQGTSSMFGHLEEIERAEAIAEDAEAKLTESQSKVGSLKALLASKTRTGPLQLKVSSARTDPLRLAKHENTNRHPLPEDQQVSYLPKWKKRYPKAFRMGRHAEHFQVGGKWIASVNQTEKSKIVGGVPAQKGEFPFMVTDAKFQCGGSLIHPRFVLTAAHCVFPAEDAPKVLHLGRHIRDEELGLGPQMAVFVKRVIIHPEFDGKVANDVALYELKEPVPEKRYKPIWLSDGYHTLHEKHGSKQLVVGWGQTSGGDDAKSSEILLKVELDMMHNKKCNRDDMATAGMLDNTHICAGEIVAGSDGFGDACRGDSGGPLFAKMDSGEFVQSGIVSWGLGCGNAKSPGVYTRVSWAYPWIASMIANADGGLRMGPDHRPPLHPEPAARCHGASRQIYIGQYERHPSKLSARAGDKVAFYNVGGWNSVRVWQGDKKQMTTHKSFARWGQAICMGFWMASEEGSYTFELLHMKEHKASLEELPQSDIEVKDVCMGGRDMLFSMELQDKGEDGLSGGSYSIEVRDQTVSTIARPFLEFYGGNFGHHAEHKFCIDGKKVADSCVIIKFHSLRGEEGTASAKETTWKLEKQAGIGPWEQILGTGMEKTGSSRTFDAQTSQYSWPAGCASIPICGDGECASGEKCVVDCGAPEKCTGTFVKDCRSGVDKCHYKDDVGDGTCHNSWDATAGANLCCHEEEYSTDPMKKNDCSFFQCKEPECNPKEGRVKDCSDEDCGKLEWVGDGVCDGLHQPFGHDLCCWTGAKTGSYDGGDCTQAQCKTFVPKCPEKAHIGWGQAAKQDEDFCYCNRGYIPNADYTECEVERIACDRLEGDMNEDQVLDVQDLVALCEFIQSGWREEQLACADLDKDDAITVLDVVQAANRIFAAEEAEYAATPEGRAAAATETDRLQRSASGLDLGDA